MATIASTPYHWPWNGVFSADRCALVINNAPVVEGDDVDRAKKTLDSVTAFARRIRQFGVLVIEVTTDDRRRHSNDGLRPIEVPVPWRMSEHGIVDADLRLRAYGVDAFYSSPLEQVLNDTGRRLVALCGTWFETSVHSTMREANDRGMECIALSDLSPCLVPELERQTICQIEMSGGIFGAVSTSTAFERLFQAHD